jgi:hypothetical protein
MPLPERQLVTVPIRGLDTRAEPKSAAPGTCELIENMRFRRATQGGVELVKRNGAAALTKNITPSGTVSVGRKLAMFNDEKLVVGDRLYGYSSVMARWLDRGASSAVSLTLEPLLSTPFGAAGLDIAVNGNLMCLVSANAHVTVIDLTTGTRLLSEVDLAFGGAVITRVFALASTFMIIGGGAGTLAAKKIDYATPTTVSGATTVLSDGHATFVWDAVRNGAADSVMICYRSAINQFKARIWNSDMTSGATGADTTLDPDTCIGFIDWDASDGNHYVAFASTGPGLRLETVATSAAITSGTAAVLDATLTTGVRNIAGMRQSGLNIVFAEINSAITFNTLIRRYPGSGTTTTVWQRAVGIATKVFHIGTSYYLPAAYESPLQSQYFLLDCTTTTPTVVTKALYGAGGGRTAVSALGSCPAIDATTVAIPVVRVIDTLPDTSSLKGGAYLRVAFDAASLSGARRLGEQLFIPGGMVRNYDGANASSEAGFHMFPETPTLAQSAGGSLTAAGVYSYRVVYVWFDGRGGVHRSAPSAPATITLGGGNQTVTATTPYLRVTEKPKVQGTGGGLSAPVYIEWYRTTAGGSTYYRVPLTEINDPAADSVAKVDTQSDATIQTNALLYTEGGALPHLPFPPARLCEVWRNRLFLAGTDNPLQLWVGNELGAGPPEGGDGPSVSDALVITMEADGGPITALAELDDRLVIFKESAIYLLSGNGPTPNGDNQFDQPARISSSIGAVDPRGVVKTRDGVMFKSARGIYTVTRSGDVVYTGAGVESSNGLTVTGAVVMEALEEVRFTTSAGTTLVYFYGLPDERGIGRWSTFTNQTAVDVALLGGTYAYLASDGTVNEESAAYADPGSVAIAAKVRMTWLALAQLFGRAFLWAVEFLADHLATYTVTMRLAYEYDATVAQSVTLAVTTATKGPLHLDAAQGHITAVQLTLEESSTTQGFALSAWGLVLGLMAGARPKPLAAYLS